MGFFSGVVFAVTAAAATVAGTSAGTVVNVAAIAII